MAIGSSLRLQVLGPARVVRTGSPDGPSLVSQPRRLALLTYLALARPRGLHSRDSLLALLWPEAGQADARHALRNALHAIRKALGPGVIVTEGDGLVGVDRSALACDALELEDEARNGRPEVLLDQDPGRLLDGFHVSNAPQFDAWLEGERRRLSDLALTTLRQLSESLERRGLGELALAAARRACDVAPYDERALRRVVELLDKGGEAAAAVAACREFETRLERDLGIAPSPTVEHLATGLRTRRPPGPIAPNGVRPMPTPDSATYIQYVRGTYLFLRAAHQGPGDDLERSRALFEEALARDPGFAQAYAGLSNYYAVAAARNRLLPFEQAFGRAIEMSRRALELDGTLAIPHVHFGVKAMYLDGDWEAAGREFAEAVARDPCYAEARRFLGIWYDVMNRPEDALAELRESVRLEPQIATFRNTLAAALMDRGDWTGAVAELERALELDPGYRAARERLVRCLEELGRWELALAERSRAPALGPVDLLRAAFEAEGAGGYRRAAEDELRMQRSALEAAAAEDPPANPGDRFNPPAVRLAVLHARLGDRAAASRCEEAACRARPSLRPWFRARPELRPAAGR